ncbi:hypothetical protein DSL72_001971 [Monilinia vaccinii-corymbosi]|uniref:Uncharacterized protein n=1 Tax=Monilinia vaccinii-corymbosi TaxID=61207 RepID=A0A8A3PBC9_9HELO|nr:hypothetical protein DSL72_001971 [Monilinia vaccinii-corymbosi]
MKTVVLTGEQETHTQAILVASGNRGKGADAYIDFSTGAAAMAAFKPFGRAAFMGVDAMAAPSRSSSYYGDMSNEFYRSSFDDYQNDIDQSLDSGRVLSSDLYLGPEMFLIPQILGEQSSLSEPCILCIRRAGNEESAAILCTRESPFIELSMTEFFSNSYPKVVRGFDVNFSGVEGQHETIKVDGKGNNSSSLDLKVIKVQSCSFSEDTLKEVCRIIRPSSTSSSSQQNTGGHQPNFIPILDSEYFPSTELEKWVIKCTYENKLDSVDSTSFVFGVAYAKEKLPHADLVQNMNKLIALNCILCNALKITSLAGQQETTTEYSVLLKANYSVGLTGENGSSSSASHQNHTLNLLIGVLTALFRSSFPLLMNFEDKCNRYLLGGNDDLIHMSKQLRRDLIAFKRRGYLIGDGTKGS